MMDYLVIGWKDRIKGLCLFVNCFDILVYNDVIIEDIILKFMVILIRFELNVVLSEFKVFVGCDMLFFKVIIFE